MAHQNEGGQATEFLQVITNLANSTEPFSDIRLEEEVPIAVRMPDGWVTLEDYFPPTADELVELLKAIEVEWEELLPLGAINRPYNLTDWRLRINACLAGGGMRRVISIRRIPRKPPTIRDTGLPPEVRLMLSVQRGLILISGATGSGKSTTAAALLDDFNENRANHIVTIEDPIEYLFERKKSIFTQREIGVDATSFNEGLREAMRQRPDVILVGEISDRDTAETALLAGESGHLVIGTVHASTAVGATQKVLSWFGDNERAAKQQALGASLVGVINQMLLPKKDGKGYFLAAELLNNYEQEFTQLIGDQIKMTAMMAQSKGSVPLAQSLKNAVAAEAVDKVAVMRATIGMPDVQDKLRNLLRG